MGVALQSAIASQPTQPDNPRTATLMDIQLSFGNLFEIEYVAYVGDG